MIDKIIIGKNVCIISPHFDDAALSCGSWLSGLEGSCSVRVINVFTKAHSGPYTLSTKRYLQNSGYSSAEDLYMDRTKEDAKVLHSLKVNEVINLGLVDSLFRRKKVSFIGKVIPEADHFYPVYRLQSRQAVNSSDAALLDLKKALRRYAAHGTVFFAPLGVGGHVDHRIARLACQAVFKDIVYYSDFPYNARTGNYGVSPEGYIRHELKVNVKEKARLLQKYKTQYKGLFSNQIMPAHKEVYFAKINYEN